MLRRRLVLFLVVSATLLLAGAPAHAQEEGGSAAAEQAAQAAVEEWLRHVDEGAWEMAWDAAAPGLRDSVSQEQWQARAARTRSRLGPVRSRRIAHTQHRTSLPQAPEAGPFVVLRYHSTFGTDLYVETLLAVEADEAWRVAGYRVAPMTGRPEQKGIH